MKETSDRLARLRAATLVVAELEEQVNSEKTKTIRQNLKKAGTGINSPSYDSNMTNALGTVAGIAIANNLDELAERATRIMDKEIELQADPIDEIKKETDDRGRLLLGAKYANKRVHVAVLETNSVDQD